MLYGCLGPVDSDRDWVLTLHHVGHQYRAVLWEIYDRHRKDYESVRDQLCGPQMGELERRVAQAKEDGDKQALRAARAAMRALRKTMTAEARAKLDEFVAEQQKRRQAEIKAARARSGVYHATYQLLEKAALEAATRPVPARARPPWNGIDGKLGVAVHPIPVSEALGCRGQWLRVDVDAGLVHLRVGSKADRSPIWVTYRCKLSGVRPLPADGIIRAAWVKARRIGTIDEWSLGFSVELERGFARKPPPHRRKHITVRVGFEGFEGLTATVARANDRAIVYDASPKTQRKVHRGKPRDPLVPRLEHARHITAQADRNYEDALGRLKAWAGGRSMPQWLHTSIAEVPRWNGPAYLRRLVELWGHRRFDGDAEMVEELCAWAQQDFHLREWAERERARAIRNRREQYRLAAVSIARTYESVTLIRGDLRDRTMGPERKDVALSELCGAIKLACANHQCTLTVASDADSAIAQSAE